MNYAEKKAALKASTRSCPKCKQGMIGNVGSGDIPLWECRTCGHAELRDISEPVTAEKPRRGKCSGKPNSSPKQTEAQFQQAILDLATACGWHHYHCFNSYRSDPGWPDLVLVHPERRKIIVAECKLDGKKLTPAQDEWLEWLHACGLDTRIWRPSGWDEIEKTLKGA